MHMSPFLIHPQLAADCWILGRLRHSYVLLHKNAVVSWFILVPETEVLEFLELPESLQIPVLQECSRIAEFIRQETNSTKINFAAIGNIVPQLHLHVVGRRPTDPCWPQPVWGHLSEQRDYSMTEVAGIVDRLSRLISLMPVS